MISTKYYWGGNVDQRIEEAELHTSEMETKYIDEILLSTKLTKIYNKDVDIKIANEHHADLYLDASDSVSSAFKFADGKTAILNFASYKNAGGGYLKGSRAQEESLCSRSFLYNVLSRFQSYYAYNRHNLNKSLYTNRALYSPNVRFFNNEKSMMFDVITCASPNITPNIKYGLGVSDDENYNSLKDRIEFIVKIAVANNVDTLILGAFGCGVFGQDATTVCTMFIEAIDKYPSINKVVFAVPQNMHSENYTAFKNVMDGVYYE